MKDEIEVTVKKLKVLTSDTAIKFMEEDIMKLEKKIEALELEKSNFQDKKPRDIKQLLTRAKYMVDHFDELVIKQIDLIRKAQFFSALFDKVPTYEDLKGGTQKTPLFTGVNSLFALSGAEKSHLVTLLPKI